MVLLSIGKVQPGSVLSAKAQEAGSTKAGFFQQEGPFWKRVSLWDTEGGHGETLRNLLQLSPTSFCVCEVA